ncbi:hypothetical protein PG988_003457 [Apiospora saccharicola]
MLTVHAHNLLYMPRSKAGDAVRDHLWLSEAGGDRPSKAEPLHSSLRSLWEQSRVVLRPYPATAPTSKEGKVEGEGEDGTLMLQFLRLEEEQDPALAESVYRHGLNNIIGRRLPARDQRPQKVPLAQPAPPPASVERGAPPPPRLKGARPTLQSLFRGPAPSSVTSQDVRSRRSQAVKNTSFWETATGCAVDAGVLPQHDGDDRWRWVVALESLDREDEADRIRRDRLDTQWWYEEVDGVTEDDFRAQLARDEEKRAVIVGERLVYRHELDMPYKIIVSPC